MRQLGWTLRTLASHWLRHPTQLVTFIVGLMAATALWSGVQAINLHARAAYDRAASAFGQSNVPMLLPALAQDVPQTLFADLRRGGWPVSPVVEGRIRLHDRAIRLVGIEPISLPHGSGPTPEIADDALRAFLSPDGQTLIAAETARDLGVVEGQVVRGDTGAALPPLHIVMDMAADLLVTDIGLAQRVLGKPDRISRFVIDASVTTPRTPLAQLAGDQLRVSQSDDAADLQRLTASFHLNLTAFGLLSFVVGLFIAHAAIGLVCEQRLPMIRTLRACGVSLRDLVPMLLLELIVLALVAGSLGLLGGYGIAQLLLPDVAASLRGLYGASVSSHLLVSPQWWAAGLAMSTAGALLASAQAIVRIVRMPVLLSAQHVAWQRQQRRWLIWQMLLGLVAMAVAGLALRSDTGLVGGFVVLGGLVVGAALALPALLGVVLRLGERLSRGPLVNWLWADSRQQLSGLSLALMALLLALAVNIGVGTMVGSFSQAFLRWLDGRLLADIYVAASDNAQAKVIADWLKARPDVTAVLPSARAETQIGGETIELVGLADNPAYRAQWPLLTASADVWDQLRDGTGVLISEQLGRRLQLGTGAAIDLPMTSGPWRTNVAGIYADYGNPKGQITLNVDQLAARMPAADRSRIGVLAARQAINGLMAALAQRFDLGGRNLADQATVKAEARRIFGRTFAVTGALNAFTLGVAGIALLTSLLSLGEARLPQLAPLWAIGVTHRTLALLEFLKTLLLALLTALFALPLGLVVAWCLIEVINVKAFGWRLPFAIFPADLLRLTIVAVAAAGVASLVPVIRLARTRPASLLKIFADER